MSGIGNASDSGRDTHRMTLILPERRRNRRYLTLKNAGIAAIVAVVAFLLLSLWSAARPHTDSSRSLLSSRAQSNDVKRIRRDPMIVSEGPVDDRPAPDPRLLDSTALDHLRASVPAAPVQSPSTVAKPTTFEPLTSQLGKGQRITISGGRNGVDLHADPKTVPTETIPPAPPR